MKTIQFLIAVLLCSIVFISCSNTATDEELQLYDNQELFAEETGEDPDPPIPPPPPDK